jgi:hypothetical protein
MRTHLQCSRGHIHRNIRFGQKQLQSGLTNSNSALPANLDLKSTYRVTSEAFEEGSLHVA